MFSIISKILLSFFTGNLVELSQLEEEVGVVYIYSLDLSSFAFNGL